MLLDMIVHKTDDGVNAEISGLRGCESWGHTEDEAIGNVLELAVYYLKLNSVKDLKIDKARGTRNKIVYKIIFNKDVR